MSDQFSKKGASKLRSITQHSVSEKVTKSKLTSQSDGKKSKVARVKSSSEKVEKTILDIDVDLLAEKLPRIRRDSVPPEKTGEDLYNDDFDEENGIFENTEIVEVVGSEINFIDPPVHVNENKSEIETVGKDAENKIDVKGNEIKSPNKENKLETVKMVKENEIVMKDPEIENGEKGSKIEIIKNEGEIVTVEKESVEGDEEEDKEDSESDIDPQETEIEFVPKLGNITRRKSYTEQLAESTLDVSSVVECPLVEGLGQEDAFKPRRASILVNSYP